MVPPPLSEPLRLRFDKEVNISGRESSGMSLFYLMRRDGEEGNWYNDEG